MEPNAKMNINKKGDSDWILCPSKSIPGKYYYFNVRTGEAVWSVTETETKTAKDINKNYDPLKPVSPPEEKQTISNIYFPRNCLVNELQQIHSFGQATFPKYISNVPNIIWTPIQLPMCVANLTEIKKQTLDQITQTSEPDRDMFVQTCAMPLTQRFALFDNIKTNLALNSNINKYNNCSNDMRSRCSTPKKNWWNIEKINSDTSICKSQIKRKHDDFKFLLREPRLKRTRTLSGSHFEHRFSNNLNSSFDTIENANFDTQHKVKNSTTNPEIDGAVKELDRGDLRILLQMKRRRSIDVGTMYNLNRQVSSQKKVTFNLDNSNDDDSFTDTNKEQSRTAIPIESLKDLMKDDIEVWYVAVDEDVLIDDFNFIMDYINGDDHCKLLIPESMVKYIESLGKGEHGGRDRVIVARQVYRQLVTSRQIQIVEAEGTSLMDDIVKCCLQVLDEDKHIVLITENLDLENVAKVYGIDVYSLDDIKNYITNSNTRDPTGNNTIDNLFLQNINDFDPFVLSKSVNNENIPKNNQFSYNKNISINFGDETDRREINNDVKDTCNRRHIFDTINNINTENNSSDVCNRIEKLKINDGKLKDIRRVINNSIFIDNSDRKISPITMNRQTDRQRVCDENNDDQIGLINNINRDNEHKSKTQPETDQRKQNYLSNLIVNLKQNETHTDLHQNSVTIDNGKNLNKQNGSAVSIDNNLDYEQRLIVDDEDIKCNIVVRLDEWVCCYVQIMEEFIQNVLQRHFSEESDMPYFLHEGLEFLKEIYASNETITAIIDKLLALNRLFTTKDINKINIEPNDYMKMLEYGFLLVEAFKNVLTEDFSETEELLVKLLESIENSTLIEEFEQIETPLRRSDEDICLFRCNFVKKRSDIIRYLKNHFVEWKNYDEVDEDTIQDENTNPNVKIFRTSGRNLNTFKIDNQKRISFENPLKDNNLKSHDNTFDRDKNQSDGEPELNIPLHHGNTFSDGNEKDGPKVIRNIKIIDKFERKVNKSTQLDLDALDYSEIVDSLSSISETKHNGTNIETVPLYNFNDDDFMKDFNDSLSLINDVNYNDARNDSTVDSGFGNEVHACTLIRSFLSELSTSFKLIYSFVDKCIKEFQEDELSDETKNLLLYKANQTHTHIADVIEKLKSIIERESADSTLKTMFIKAGNDVTEDKRMTRYRQTVTKCLEQAQVLEISLKIMLNITSNDCDISLSSRHGITHFNIFE
ncbi:protein PFC0760c-like isoform X2 [Vanessa atalanta]|uniref:protein PFC0760c-like isoform X2 n=1 Tax=Vanessa atalanta TaxID=42275 RepID=UPI001FCD499E|nr:protein PFC0760c-like isoform X2 [Vanessa atalanta]